MSLRKQLFLVGAICLGLVSLARAFPARAETIQVEGGLAISGEFTGASVENLPAGERAFTTSLAPTFAVPIDQPVSPEATFRTLPFSPLAAGELAISDELTFQTPVQPEPPVNPPGGGGNDNGGGGGSSGGGYGYRLSAPATLPLPGECPTYLAKFIRFGVDNDPAEVLKLQRFLRDYEGFSNVPLSGVYDLVTYRAVMAFQTRYADAILKPWGIDYPTGYVYITTSLAINNLYCERDPTTTLDLRSHRLALPDEATTPPTTPFGPWLEVGEADNTNRFLTAALGALDFFKRIPMWWWLLFILGVLFLFIHFRRL